MDTNGHKSRDATTARGSELCVTELCDREFHPPPAFVFIRVHWWFHGMPRLERGGVERVKLRTHPISRS